MNKKFFLPLVLLFFILSLCLSNQVIAVSFRVFYGLAGGATGDMDRHNNATCTANRDPFSCCTGSGTGTCDPTDNDVSLVVENVGDVITGYLYHFDGDSTQAESSPYYIRPDNYSSGGVWHLIDSFALTPSSTPGVNFRDVDATDLDINSRIAVNCTDTGSGTEDCDYSVYVQIAGVDTQIFHIDADGYLNIYAKDMNLASGQVYRIDGTQITITDLGNFSSSTLRSKITDPTGTGASVFGTSPAITTPTITSPIIQTSINLPSSAIDALTEIAAGLKSGADGDLITGTAGTNGNLGCWNPDGDIVDCGSAPSDYESSSSNDFDPDRLAGDTVDDNLVDDAIIASTVTRDSELSSAVAALLPLAGGTMTGAILLDDDASLKIDATPDGMADDKYNGITLVGINFGETVGQWACVFLASDGKVDIADADAAGEFPALGIVVAGGDDTDPAIILTRGVVRNEGWTGLTVGGAVYLGDDGTGAITQTAPSTSGDAVQIIGRALSDSEIYFNFSGHWLEVE